MKKLLFHGAKWQIVRSEDNKLFVQNLDYLNDFKVLEEYELELDKKQIKDLYNYIDIANDCDDYGWRSKWAYGEIFDLSLHIKEKVVPDTKSIDPIENEDYQLIFDGGKWEIVESTYGTLYYNELDNNLKLVKSTELYLTLKQKIDLYKYANKASDVGIYYNDWDMCYDVIQDLTQYTIERADKKPKTKVEIVFCDGLAIIHHTDYVEVYVEDGEYFVDLYDLAAEGYECNTNLCYPSLEVDYINVKTEEVNE